jgi:predicted DNA-binding transcriptional regulator YafY
MRGDRLVSILLLLQARGRVTARELAERLEVSERTILRDMDALSGSGVPVVAERGSGGGWSLLNGYQVKITGLNAGEIQSLFVGQPRLMEDLGLQQSSERALLKLRAALPEGSREQADFARERVLIDTHGWRDRGESATLLPIVMDALWRERRIKFVYERQGCDLVERIGDPLGLVSKGSVWYLVATVDGETRTYRVSRMREAEILDQAASRPKDFNLAAHWDRSATEFREHLPRYYATFIADTEVMRWVRYRGWRLEEEIPEADRVRIRVRFDIEEEALQFALSFGRRIDVVEPPELRAQVLESARAILARCHHF